MGFLGVYRAIYNYEPQDDGELAISEGDLLYVLEKNDDDGWWKAKKKAAADEDDEPVGLVPHNYVEEAKGINRARAIYEYTRQTDEELSFSEDALLEIYDASDPDWILAGVDNEYGFVPSNYIDMGDGADAAEEEEDEADEPPPSLPTRPRAPQASQEPSSPAAPANPVAAVLAGVMQDRAAAQAASPPPKPSRPTVQFQDAPASDEESERSPALPSRPRPQHSASSSNDYGEPPSRRATSEAAQTPRSPGSFHMYNISEMVSVMGKRKKMPTTLGINLGTGTILIAPERAQDDPPQEWTADKMTHYSREGKHVFMELVRPSKSIDFHAGAKDTAEEIVGALGELAGATKAEGLREVILAGSTPNQRKGTVLYDFMAQGDDEVTVAAGDDVIIVDDMKSEEWWQVRRIKNGNEGVVPSSYVEITGTITPPPAGASSGVNTGLSTIEQNRMEELRLTKEAMRASKEPQEVGPGLPLQQRGSSLRPSADGNNNGQQRRRRENGKSESGQHSRSKSKPDATKIRSWTDRSKSFSVEAQFLGLKDGKIHLHKMNGVKIAVPIAKMSQEDLVYVEQITGISLDDERPLADVKRSKSISRPTADIGAKVERSAKPEYDWFEFFLSCDVPVGLCERYAQSFIKDSMDESVLPDVDANILRTLGIREGDIIKIMRTLDTKFDRDRSNKNESESSSGGLFSGPGGALRNNTRKGRPAPVVQTSDVVDAAAFSKKETSSPQSESSSSRPAAPAKSKPSGGFDDDAWDVKPSSNAAETKTGGTAAPVPVKPITPALTGSMQELSLLSEPLQPTKKIETQITPSDKSSEVQQQAAAQVTTQQPQGATPSFFSSVPAPGSSPKTLARQRPLPASVSPPQGSLIPPPPQRPLSTPNTAPSLTPHMTGLVQGQVAPPGQSLNDITQARMQQQYAAQMQQMQQMQPNMTGFQGQQPTGMQYPMATGAQFMQPMYTGISAQSPFQDPGRQQQFMPIQAHPTGFAGSFQQQPYSTGQGGSVNNYLPPALEPQRTSTLNAQQGMSQPLQQQPTGYNSFSPPPQTPQPLQPLQPQQTGPPPPVRFGVTGDTKKLTPQATGRRANLAQATPQNPFGF